MDRKFRIFIIASAVLTFLTSSCAIGPFDPPSYPIPHGSEGLISTLGKRPLEPKIPKIKNPKIKIQKPIKLPPVVKVK